MTEIMKNQFTKIILCAVLAMNSIGGLQVFAQDTPYMEIYVSENGNDSNAGTKDSPVKTIETAQKLVRANNDKMTGDIVVNIMPGTYQLDKMLEFSVEDSGKNGHNVIYRGENKPVITGANKIDNFKQSSKNPLLIEAYIPNIDRVTEFYVDGEKKYVAKGEEWFNPSNYKEDGSGNSSDGIMVSKEYVQQYKNLEDVRFIWNRGWVKTLVQPTEIIESPSDKEKMIVKFKNPKWNTVLEGGSSTTAGASISCYVENAFELLDTPGEFYFDKNEKKLYYMCEDGESAENSEFTVPMIDTAMFIMGKTIDDRVKNITFDGITFEGFTGCAEPDDYASSGQGPTYGGNWNGRTDENDFGVIYVNRAENINFTNNIFTGMGQDALNYKDAVKNCLVEGNAFYDISGCGVVIGTGYHIEFDFGKDDPRSKEKRFYFNYKIEENPSTDFNMMILHPYIFSSNPSDRKALGMSHRGDQYSLYPHESFFTTSIEDFKNYALYGNELTWHSDPEKVASGEKPYIMYDFVKSYTFSEITLAFKPDAVTDEEKTGYEVLLSNDKDFKEYTTVAVQNTAADEIADYKVQDSGKYRYMMIRALSAKPLAVTSVYSFTPDLPNQIIREMCTDITIKNNYFTRVADTEYSAIPIFAFACENLNIEHNEISELPYTGISLGLNWGFYGKCGKFNVKNNYIHDTNKYNYDGGAIYTLGNHIGSTIEENYIYNTNGGVGIYLDNGTNTVYVDNNVDEFTRYTITQNQGAINNTINNMYSLRSHYDLNGDGNTSTAIKILAEPQEYVIGNEPSTVAEIKENAGLEKEYEHIKNWVPERTATTDIFEGFTSNCSIRTHRHPAYHDGILYALNNLSEVKGNSAEVEKLIAEAKTYSDVNAKNSSQLWGITEQIVKLVSKMPYSKLIENSEKLLDEVTPTDAINSANGKSVETKYYNALKKLVESYKNGAEISRDELEAAYNAVEENLSVPQLEAVYVNGKECEINTDTYTVTVLSNEEISADNINVQTGANTVLASAIKNLKPGETQRFAICAKPGKQYEYWTLAVKDNETSGISKEGFIFDGYVDNKIISSGNGTSFKPLNNAFCYYFNGIVDCKKENTFKFSVNDANWNNKVNFMLGVSDLDGFTTNAGDAKYDRIELEVFNKILKAHLVQNGSHTVLDDKICDIAYDGINTVSYRFEYAGENTVVLLNVNGKDYKITAPKVIDGDKFGFYSKNNTVTIY